MYHGGEYRPVGALDLDHHSWLRPGVCWSVRSLVHSRTSWLLRAAKAVQPPGWNRRVNTMVRAYHMIGVLSLVGASIVLGLCAVRWLENDPEPGQIYPRSAIEIFADSAGSYGGPAEVEASPLVRQAEALASYLAPVSVRESSIVSSPGMAVPPATALTPPVSPPSPSPMFTLSGTSYYQSQPQKSMAIISMRSGQATDRRWVKEGTQVGHFVIHEIRPGAIVYRDQGSGQGQEMRVERGSLRPGLLRRDVPEVPSAKLARTMQAIDSEPNGTTDGVP